MKRGLSPVIAVVLLVLITVIAATIIITFVVPFVNKSLDESEGCFSVLGDLSFDQTIFNCFNETHPPEDPGRTGFSIRVDSDEIVGFRVALISAGSSDGIDIEEGVDGSLLSPQIRMLESIFGGLLEVPGRGGVRTYVANGTYDKAEIFPILADGGKCGLADDILFSLCNDPQAHSLIGNN